MASLDTPDGEFPPECSYTSSWKCAAEKTLSLGSVRSILTTPMLPIQTTIFSGGVHGEESFTLMKNQPGSFLPEKGDETKNRM